MAHLFRSESMVYARMVISDDTAYDTIKQIGHFGKAHIVDLSLRQASTAPNERIQYYKKRVANCGYYERKFQQFHLLLEQYKVKPPSIDEEPQEMRGGDIVETVKAFIEPLESTLTKNILYAREQRAILTTLQERLDVIQVVGLGGRAIGSSTFDTRGGAEYGTFASGENTSLLATELEEAEFGADEEKGNLQGGGSRVIPRRQYFMSSIYGIIPDDKIHLFERMVFRVSRGNVVCKIFPLQHPPSEDAKHYEADPLRPGHFLRKSVFQVTFVGELLGRRLKKIVSYVGGIEYDVPSEKNAIVRLIQTLSQQIKDSKQLLSITEGQVRNNLKTLTWDAETRTSPYINYTHALKVEKAICDTLKKCELERAGSNLLRLEAWIPEDDYAELQSYLKLAVSATGLQPAACQKIVPGTEGVHLGMPPTYFKTDKFTSSYQGIVDTYGTPRYKEVNPGLFTIISFPFLFGVMYGDVGHGTLLTLGALYFILREKYYNRLIKYGEMDEIIGMVFGGRYLLIAMGLFAVYAGFIYNDCFSLPLNIFGSRWFFPGGEGVPAIQQGVYPMGVDPSWYHTANELAFFNSLKMKLAVTLGVTQMVFGICLGAFNNTYFNDRAGLFFEFIPRVTFMLSTFGYMVFLIIYKFTVDWRHSPVSPPNLVQTMIAMFLAPGHVEEDKQLYVGQAGIQSLLLFLALISVPIMLLAQPLLARSQHNAIYGTKAKKEQRSLGPRSTARYQQVESKEEDDLGSDASGDDEKAGEGHGHKAAKHVSEESSGGGHGPDPKSPHYSFGDHAITQGIHTIEFVLGAVSNTASYLRLWALSLAHAELSSVFWSKMISQAGLETGSPILMVIGMAGWAAATFSVLLAMDVLECFLHALRLHWVEFQNKFFHADGIAYRPFSYDNIEVQE